MNLRLLLPRTWLRKAREYSRKLWVRVVAMGLLAFVALGLTQLIEGLVPREVGSYLSGEAADHLLEIIANAMLAVTIFSITIMVTVYRASSTQFTPRVHRLIIQDRTTQNTLAVFIGAYVFSLVGIILRELGVYGDDRALVLFLTTVLVLAVIVIYLIRWVLHLQTFGSLIDTTRQIETVTREQFEERLADPCLGARAFTGEVPEGADTVTSPESGYIQHIYPEALEEKARMHGVEVYLIQSIGSFVFKNEPILKVVKTADPEEEAEDRDMAEDLLDNVVVGDLRTFDQDPRFGLIVMGEVGSKALSPGVNDPGTAIDVITRIGRILSFYKDEVAQDRDVRLDRLHALPLEPADLLEDGFGALARDGASVVEVQQRLQQTLAGLMRHPDRELREAAGRAARVHLARALAAIDFGPDRERLLRSAASEVRDDVTGAQNTSAAPGPSIG